MKLDKITESKYYANGPVKGKTIPAQGIGNGQPFVLESNFGDAKIYRQPHTGITITVFKGRN